MSWFPKTLWDLLKGPPLPPEKGPRREREPSAKPIAPRREKDDHSERTPRRKPTMQEKYAALIVEMKTTYGVRVRKWRSSTSGCAWEVHYHDGSTARLIESPRPRGPMSCAIFLHEIGHHAIGFGRYRPRCLEEYHAWRWALETMRQRGFNVTPAVEKRMAESLRWAVSKGARRGLRRIPRELLPYVTDGE
ncbi:MAG: hypothetical protein SYC29_10870 [Planctomycetota bacterium]|nr:hypothetical protein [Planctomycetota bacterium]